MAAGDRQRVGAAGERLVARHYEHLGYAVLDRNWRCDAGELDLVVRRGAVLVVCEVKTRRTAGFGPWEAVTPAKQRRLRHLAARWLAAHPGRRFDSVRFDVAGVAGGTLTVREAAF
jgi:putative endonuclease